MTEPKIRELRFTRSRQATGMLALGAFFAIVAIAIIVLQWRDFRPPPLWIGMVMVPFSALCFWIGLNQARHPFLVLSRLGVEIYPFFRPGQNMNHVTWQEIAAAEVNLKEKLFILTLANYEDSKIIVTTKPLSTASEKLLAEAIRGVMNQRSSESSPA